MAHTNSLIMPFSSQSPAKPVDSDLTNIPSESTQELDDIDDDNANEQSPLLPPNGSPTDGTVPSPLEDVVEWLGDAYESKSSGYMFLLTLGIFGLQMGWAVQQSNGSPYFMSLGMNKALLGLVWISGPLTGVLVQPYVGLKSDRSRSKWGKRRPYVVLGAVIGMVSIMILAWAREIVSGFLGIFGADPKSNGVTVTIALFAVVLIYIFDIALNLLEAGVRSYAVDCTPHHQQETANAWMTRMVGIGNIFAMFCGGMNLPKVFPFLGNTQFKGFGAITAVCMGLTAFTSVASIPERDPRLDPEHPDANQGLIQLFHGLWKSVFRLPPQIVKICQVQFLAWMGWFPFLYYTTTYVGEIYVQPFFEANPNMTTDEVDRLLEAGTRRGTMALLLFAIVTFLTSIILPFFIPPNYKIEPTNPGPTIHLSSSDTPTKLSVFQSSFTQVGSKISALLTRLEIPSLTLRRVWLYSHILFCFCMWSTLMVRSVPLATGLIAVVGVPWAITMWAPFALISAEISKRDAIRRGVLPAPPTTDGALLAANEDDTVDQAGIVLGIHNVAISAPQVIATVVGSVLFKWLQKERGEPGDESVAWFFRLGGLCALYAAWLTRQVGEEGGLQSQTQGHR